MFQQPALGFWPLFFAEIYWPKGQYPKVDQCVNRYSRLGADSIAEAKPTIKANENNIVARKPRQCGHLDRIGVVKRAPRGYAYHSKRA
jgi:hypothetical protein